MFHDTNFLNPIQFANWMGFSFLNINLQPLPGYSPDFIPAEHLLQWLREDITYHTCYDKKQELINAITNF